MDEYADVIDMLEDQVRAMNESSSGDQVIRKEGTVDGLARIFGKPVME
jgi:hypothetical protein